MLTTGGSLNRSKDLHSAFVVAAQPSCNWGQNLFLLLHVRIMQPVTQHEAVELAPPASSNVRFARWDSAWQTTTNGAGTVNVLVAMVTAVLHRFEQRALDLARRGDFGPQQQVREDRPSDGRGIRSSVDENFRADMSEGNRSMVNCTRGELEVMALAIALTSSVLARPACLEEGGHR